MEICPPSAHRFCRKYDSQRWHHAHSRCMDTKIYNGKETFELYGGEKELNELLLTGYMQSAVEVKNNAKKLLDGMKK